MFLKTASHIIIFIFLSISCFSQEWSKDNLTIYRSFDDLENEILNVENDTTYIINFWATWCGPCVKELPYFEKLNDVYRSQKLKVVLVSLDFEKHIDRKLLPFLNKKNILSDVVVLLDPKESKWIDKVDPSWSGAIPITIIKKKNERKFYERVFHNVGELEEIINPILNN